MSTVLGIGLIIIGLGIVFAILYKKSVIDKKINELNDLEDEVTKSKIKAKEIIENAEKDAQAKGKEIELKAKAEHFENNSSKRHTISSELAYFCYRPF